MKLEEVARLAGVSRSTVSRVVNQDRRVSNEVRERVQTIIRKHDYHPNSAARSLASKRTRILGLFIPQASTMIFSDPFFPKLIQGAVEACNEADHSLTILMEPSEDRDAVERLYRRVFRGRHMDGVIVASNVIDDPIVNRLMNDDFPFLLVGRHPRHQDISFVDVDNRSAAHDAVTHLVGHGYRRIGIIGGISNMIAFIDRYAGYVTALQEAGLMPDPALVVHCPITQQGGYEAMRRLLPHRPEAVFVASDEMALGALRALDEAGRSVPKDIAIFAFDGLPQTAVTNPPLSTVEQPIEGLGYEAVRAMLGLLDRPAEERSPVHVYLPTRLALRRSCGCSPVARSLLGEEVVMSGHK